MPSGKIEALRCDLMLLIKGQLFAQEKDLGS
jgi:hypothetical protein